jgi:hypothetical protein
MHFAFLRASHMEGRNMYTILMVLLILMLLGALPTWPYSRGWGYYPSGGLGVVLVILIVLVLMRQA